MTRDQIVRAAIKVFGGKSFLKANISEIAQEAEVAEGTIYQHFKNKEDLLFFIPRERTAAFCEGLELHLQGIQGASNKLVKFAWYYLYFFKENPEYARIAMLELRVNKNFQKTKGYRLFRGWSETLLDMIKEGQEEGTIRDDMDPHIVKELLLGVLEHYVTRWLLKDEKWDLLEFLGHSVDLVLNGIRARKQTKGEAARMGKPAEITSAQRKILKNKQMV